MLYIALGDGGRAATRRATGAASRPTWPRSSGSTSTCPPARPRPYEIPADNPFATGEGGALPEIWLTGLRNPWRMHFDPQNGDLWIGDVGQGAWEEIDVARAGVGGLDYGWNTMEGAHCYQPRPAATRPA